MLNLFQHLINPARHHEKEVFGVTEAISSLIITTLHVIARNKYNQG